MLISSPEGKLLFLPARRRSSFGHQVCFSPHLVLPFQADTAWVCFSCSPLLGGHCLGLLQLNSDTLPGDSFQAHKLRTHFRKIALTSDANQKSQVLIHTSDQLAVDQGFPHPPSRVRQSTILAHRTQRDTYLQLLVYYKGMHHRNRWMEKIHRSGDCFAAGFRRAWCFFVLWACQPPTPRCVHQAECSSPILVQKSLWIFISIGPTPFPQGPGVVLQSFHSNNYLIFLVISSVLRLCSGFILSEFSSINSCMVKRVSL